MNPHCIQSQRIKCLLSDIVLAKGILKAQVESDDGNHDLDTVESTRIEPFLAENRVILD